MTNIAPEKYVAPLLATGRWDKEATIEALRTFTDEELLAYEEDIIRVLGKIGELRTERNLILPGVG